MKRCHHCSPRFFLCAAFAVQAQTLTQADRDKAMQYLESTKQGP